MSGDHIKPPSLEDLISSDSDPPKESDEDITSTTLQAIMSPRENSFVALLKYVRRKHRGLDHRMRRIERLIVFVMGGGTAVLLALELYRTFAVHH
ncbi:MAG: hypothetical protein ACYCPT_02095 [Acidimicrobiales bacterium]